MILEGKNVVLGVTGGIACYKAVDLCSKLVQAGANVDVIMTEAATRFVTPLPFQTITKRPVSTDMFQLLRDTDMAHISLAKRADVVIVAPATANTIAKIARGLADNLLTATVLATTAPLVLAPAMDSDMWAHPATRENVALVVERGAAIVGPGRGRLASGRTGEGRLASTEEILAATRQVLGKHGRLEGLRVMVTAGGTQEPLDPVRLLTNRSSGRMGYALAEAARDAGASVTLVHAPTALAPVYGVKMIGVWTAVEMQDAVLSRVSDCDVLIMAAAVADYRPRRVLDQKMKKGDGQSLLTLELERTPDILGAVADLPAGSRPCVVGFAAETEDLIDNARAKLEAKRMDMIVANDVSRSDSGFGVDTNRVTLLDRDGRKEDLPLMSKFEVSERVMERVAAYWRAAHA